MSKVVTFISDTHGKVNRYLDIIKTKESSIQLGDFACGFGEYYTAEKFDYMIDQVPGNHRFIRGNHDDPAECAKSSHWIPDGTVEGDMMFIGGASSIDKDWRTPGVDWWPDEELSQERLNECMKVYREIKPRIMITHESPEQLVDILTQKSSFGKIKEYSRTRWSFAEMFETYEPEIWLFAHWHQKLDFEYKHTRFICMPELGHIDLDIS